MKIAKQADLDAFIESIIFDDSIYPYLSTSKFFNHWTEKKGDWEGIFLTDAALSFMMHVSFDRARDIEFTVCLYAKNKFSAGRAIMAVKELIKRYKPRAINSLVHSSNCKSLKLNRHVFGKEWGIEKGIAWNSAKGEYEDLHYFRMLL